MSRVVGLLFALLTTTTTAAHAQNFAPRLLGGRTGSMGGVGVAFGDDAAMAFLNPAGLSRVPTNVLSLSLSAYRFDAVRYDDFFAQSDPPDFMGQFDASGNELRSTSFAAQPSSLSYVVHVDATQVVALSFLIPASQRRALDGTYQLTNPFVTSSNGFSLVREETTNYMGGSYAAAFGPLRVGTSVFLAYTERTSALETEDVSGTVPATDFHVLRGSVFLEGSSFDLVLAVGAQLDLGPLRLGFSVHAASVHLGGSFDRTSRLARFGNGQLDTPDLVERRNVDGDFEARQPLRASAGAAFVLGSLTIAADVHLVVPSGDYDRLAGTARLSTLAEGQAPSNTEMAFVDVARSRTTVNASAGVEYRVSDSFAVRAGAFTDFSGSDISDLETVRIATERIDRFGATLGTAFAFGAGETSIAVGYVGGQGSVIGLDTGNSANTAFFRESPALQSSFMVLISGAVDVESLLAG